MDVADKLHIAQNGARKGHWVRCYADPGACPFGGEHLSLDQIRAAAKILKKPQKELTKAETDKVLGLDALVATDDDDTQFNKLFDTPIARKAYAVAWKTEHPAAMNLVIAHLLENSNLSEEDAAKLLAKDFKGTTKWGAANLTSLSEVLAYLSTHKTIVPTTVKDIKVLDGFDGASVFNRSDLKSHEVVFSKLIQNRATALYKTLYKKSPEPSNKPAFGTNNEIMRKSQAYDLAYQLNQKKKELELEKFINSANKNDNYKNNYNSPKKTYSNPVAPTRPTYVYSKDSPYPFNIDPKTLPFPREITKNSWIVISYGNKNALKAFWDGEKYTGDYRYPDNPDTSAPIRKRTEIERKEVSDREATQRRSPGWYRRAGQSPKVEWYHDGIRFTGESRQVGGRDIVPAKIANSPYNNLPDLLKKLPTKVKKTIKPKGFWDIMNTRLFTKPEQSPAEQSFDKIATVTGTTANLLKSVLPQMPEDLAVEIAKIHTKATGLIPMVWERFSFDTNKQYLLTQVEQAYLPDLVNTWSDYNALATSKSNVNGKKELDERLLHQAQMIREEVNELEEQLIKEYANKISNQTEFLTSKFGDDKPSELTI